MHRFREFLTRSLLFCVALPALAVGVEASTERPHVRDEILVRFKAGVKQTEKARAHEQTRSSVRHAYRLEPELQLIKLAPGTTVEEALRLYRAMSEVEIAEPNHIVYPAIEPRVDEFPQQWGLKNTGQSGGLPDFDIDAPQAWDLNTDASGVVIGVIDTGVDVTHSALDDNLWVNSGEVPGNAIDDDGNGFVDDVHGFDFIDWDGDPEDNDGHGTHVAGIIGAENHIWDTVGVVWTAQLMNLKVCDPDVDPDKPGSECSCGGIRAAIDYATDHGARVTNNSYGGGTCFTVPSAIQRARDAGVLFVAAAGNAATGQPGTNNDVTPFYPASYTYDNILSVANAERDGDKAFGSHYGPTSVDLAAPGTSILSTVPGDAVGWKSGTSMSAPHVTGVIAGLMGYNPGLDYQEYRDLVLDNVEPAAAFAGLVATGGMLNFQNAIEQTLPPGGAFYPIGIARSELSPSGGYCLGYDCEVVRDEQLRRPFAGTPEYIVHKGGGRAGSCTGWETTCGFFDLWVYEDNPGMSFPDWCMPQGATFWLYDAVRYDFRGQGVFGGGDCRPMPFSFLYDYLCASDTDCVGGYVCDGTSGQCVDPCPDSDGDGYLACEDDCDDSRAAVNPGASESCQTPYDDDCDNVVNEGCGGGSGCIKGVCINDPPF